jgi:hypothetical protein
VTQDKIDEAAIVYKAHFGSEIFNREGAVVIVSNQ